MGNFKKYAETAKQNGLDLVAAYNKAVKKVEAAEKVIDTFDTSTLDAWEIQRETEKRKQAAESEKKYFKNEVERLKEAYTAKQKANTDAFKNALRDYYAVKASDVDAQAMELIKSDILTADDFIALANDYSDNPTMQRLISERAREYVNDKPIEERAKLQALTVGDMKQVTQRRFDELTGAIDIICGRNFDITDYNNKGRLNRLAEMLDGQEVAAAIENL